MPVLKAWSWRCGGGWLKEMSHAFMIGTTMFCGLRIKHSGLKLRLALCFHELGNPTDPASWIPLPYWVRQAMINNPDIAYADKLGRRNREYISLACDNLPILKGRSPIQAYSDFMRSLRDTFKEYLGLTVTGVQVGMGPAGELRYPSSFYWDWDFPDYGVFQCYDKYMLASLRDCAHQIGMPDWGTSGPRGDIEFKPIFDDFSLSCGSWDETCGTPGDMSRPEQTDFFKSNGIGILLMVDSLLSGILGCCASMEKGYVLLQRTSSQVQE